MARSLKKGPFVDEKLLKKIQEINEGGKKKVIKTWSRHSMITPEFVGHTLAIHNGNKFIPVFKKLFHLYSLFFLHYLNHI